MERLIIKLGLLWVVLVGIVDTSFAQSFSVQRIGNGQQAVVLIPGFACSGDIWHQTVDSLRSDYTCYVLTMPGFAGVAPEANPSFDDWAKQISDFIRSEGIEKPILIGHSMGGGLALKIASTNADLGLTLSKCPTWVYRIAIKKSRVPREGHPRFCCYNCVTIISPSLFVLSLRREQCRDRCQARFQHCRLRVPP